MPELQFERLIFERKGTDGEVLWLSLSNPEMRNALDDKMQVELLDVLDETKDDGSIRCVVLRGAGKVFCSGGDIRGFEGMNPVKGEWFSVHRGQAIQNVFTSLGKPIIAAVDGWCLAGGTELALMCDFIYATEAAKFGLTEIALGLLPGWGGLTRLPRAVGARRAREMIYRAEVLNASEAERVGLVNRVFPSADEMYAQTDRIATEIAAKSHAAVRVARSVIADTANASDEVAMSLERGGLVYLLATRDVQEGVNAFIEKRAPKFNQRP